MMKNNHVKISVLERKDLEELRLLRNDCSTNHFLTDILPINEYIQEEWFKKISSDKSKIYFAIKNINGVFVGVVRCDEWDKNNRSIRIGIDIKSEHRRKGYATEAYLLLFRYFFEQLGINRIWFLVVEYNKIAIELYKKIGFVQEGIMREAIYRDNKFNNYIIMGFLKKEYEKKYHS